MRYLCMGVSFRASRVSRSDFKSFGAASSAALGPEEFLQKSRVHQWDGLWRRELRLQRWLYRCCRLSWSIIQPWLGGQYSWSITGSGHSQGWRTTDYISLCLLSSACCIRNVWMGVLRCFSLCEVKADICKVLNLSFAYNQPGTQSLVLDDQPQWRVISVAALSVTLTDKVQPGDIAPKHWSSFSLTSISWIHHCMFSALMDQYWSLRKNDFAWMVSSAGRHHKIWFQVLPGPECFIVDSSWCNMKGRAISSDLQGECNINRLLVKTFSLPQNDLPNWIFLFTVLC